MLDRYKIGQPLVYTMLNNAIDSDKLSHAYLFDANGNDEVYDIIYWFVKTIFCRNISDKKKINNICKRIDDSNYIDLKIIEPDGLWLKKEQILDLQNEFSKKAIEGDKKVYIIKSADKMNTQTANSILKFLEEPVDDIVAILVVDNINLVLPTILSRCQIVKLNKNRKDDFSSIFSFLDCSQKYKNIELETQKRIIEDVLEFIMYIENNNLDTLIYIKKYWHNKFKDRDLNIIAVDLMINFYYTVIKYISNINIDFFCDNKDILKMVADKNDIMRLVNKIEVLDNIKSNLKRNSNIGLSIDKMVIDMCGEIYD